MKIGLFQPDINNSAFDNNEIRSNLDNTIRQRADLLIFPEYYPFWEGKSNAPILNDAVEQLKALSVDYSCPFIAGGYARQSNGMRNFCCLFNKGSVSEPYFKQRKYGDELDPGSSYSFLSGNKLVKFHWNGNSVIPLICADAIETLGMSLNAFKEKLSKLGAGRKIPIVVVSYSKRPMGNKWTSALQNISDGISAPVVFCNYASLDDDGYGGGGSGLFMPGQEPNRAPNKTGLFIFEIPPVI